MITLITKDIRISFSVLFVAVHKSSIMWVEYNEMFSLKLMLTYEWDIGGSLYLKTVPRTYTFIL